MKHTIERGNVFLLALLCFLFLLSTLFAVENGNATSECESENSISCSANTLYRCVNDGSGKLVKKEELFSANDYSFRTYIPAHEVP